MDSEITTEKPSTLDFILAFTPIPVIGEIKARKVARYASMMYTGVVDEVDASNKFKSARVFAYSSIPVIMGGVYIYSHLA